MNITRKNFLRLTSATTMAAAIEAMVTACGGGGGGGDTSSASTSTGAGTGATIPDTTTPGVSNPSSGTGDGTTITPPTSPPATPSVATPTATMNWSDPATWAGPGVPAGYVPGPNDTIYITSAQTVYIDANAVCGTLTIYGTLRSPLTPTKNISLTTGNINVMASGALQIGTEAVPFPAAYKATITLNGAEVGRVARTVLGTRLGFTNSGEGRSIRVEAGGKLSLIGQAPAVKRTKLNSTSGSSYPAGAKNFTLADSVDWKAGDEIVIGTTDFYGVSVPEKLTLTSNASGSSVTTTTGITTPRWAVKQYVTDAGMSLSQGTLTGAPSMLNGSQYDTPTVLDERAFVINLTRNIVVQGANDTAWTSNKFGVHCMFMGRTSDIKCDGVQFLRAGQAGALGRYPIHWHMMSYNMPSGMSAVSDGAFLGAVVGSHYAKNCSVSDSGQRMMVIHGTHGVTLDSNVGFDITGHAIFLEDGSEQNNFITNNVVMKVRAPSSTNKLLNHDIAAVLHYDGLGGNTTTGSTGYWNTNPKNTFTNNWSNDCAGAGFWSSFGNQCFGLSINVALVPKTTSLTLIDGTVSMGNNGAGQLTNDIVINDKGDISQDGYTPSFLTTPIKNLNLFKNRGGGYSNRIVEGQYLAFICADNSGMDVFGQSTSQKSVMRNTLTIAESLNNANSTRLSTYRAAFATYHEFLNFKDILAVGYTYIQGIQGSTGDIFVGGGVFRLWDLYMNGLFTFSENTGWKQINCNTPFRTLPPFKDGQPINNRNWSLAGAIYDHTGIFGHQGNYWVYDDQFLTYSATNPTNISAGVPTNGKITPDHYFDISGFKHAGDLSLFNFQSALNVSRQDASGTEVGTWNVPDGTTSRMLGIMRNFAAHQGGRYKVTFPSFVPNNYAEFTAGHQKDPADIFLIGIAFDCTQSPIVYQRALSYNDRLGDGRLNVTTSATSMARGSGYGRYLNPTGSMSSVVADTTGTVYFKDTVNNLIWMQVKCQSLAAAGLAAGAFGTEIQALDYQRILVVVSV